MGAREPDPSHVVLGQAAFYLSPGCTAIGRAVDAAARATIDQHPDMPPPLVAGGDNSLAVARIDDEFINAGILIDAQDC